MTTGSFTDWAGSIADIGPIYPFVGTEFILFLIGMAFWVAWHIVQIKGETARLKEDEDRFS